MKQREIWLVDLNPINGSEKSGIRPVVVVSGDSMNKNLGLCIVCPLSSKIKNYAGCIVLRKDSINGLDVDSEVITFQVLTISRNRAIRKLGEISKLQLQSIKVGLDEILTY
jgi:mRNA interferase MazF